ncbi:MAG: hypothetical protein KY466_13505 [Gemmatimonadetes bacterium]|nr:hypothetical protein [Gemmatimonadota bacterium]
MDFFEVLIILAFILLPLLEGIFKRRRAGQEEDAPIQPAPHRERERVGQGAGATSAGGSSAGGRAPEEPVDAGPAADMIPQDLWEVLTGERRSAPASGEPSWEDEEEPWVQAPVEEFPDELGAGEGEVSPWAREHEDIADVEPETTEPVSPHHGFPQVVSLEGPPPPPEVRHRRFHEKYDSEALPAAPVATDFARDLRSGLRGQGLRRSVVLAEVLGPPKGLL